ncbi:alkaline phosphatase [Desulfonatronum thioautotrophicum]|uniref:alkaline phosphatase n=1 Tax=Desulfonatronum thioautotrophicum TaxID=617001 RepID=UPI00069C68A3|nr:alkaline phosphatase [Desulfonatronum thioautotrophicum]
MFGVLRFLRGKVRHVVLAAFMAASLVMAAQLVSANDVLHTGSPAKYVFVFIGDGMGVPHRQAPEIFLAAKEGKRYGEVKMTMNTFPAQGLTSTFANDRFIIGSAASATAISTGYTTNIGFIGMDPELRPVRTIAQMAKEKGMRVGIVSSVSIDHATPAAFYSHQPHRSMYHEIAHDLANSGFDYFGGGGFRDIKGNRSKEPLGDAFEVARNNGYTIVNTREDILALTPGTKAIAYNANLPDGRALPYAMDMTDSDVSLAEFTAKGIELLDNPDGFFMMVEGGKIDWASHANDAVATIWDTLAFDEAIKHAVEFAKKHPEETLIVITGDHECGGMSLGFAGTQYESAYDVLKSQKVSFKVFEGMVREYRDENKGNVSFEDMKPVITENFGLLFEGDEHMALKDHELRALREAFTRSMAGLRERGMGEDYLLYGNYDPLTIKLTHILNQKAGIAWASFAHTGAPVTTSAWGVGHQIFNGFYHQSDLGRKLMSVLGFTPQHVADVQDGSDIRLVANQ